MSDVYVFARADNVISYIKHCISLPVVRPMQLQLIILSSFAGTAYGKGVYFATFASLSHGYAAADPTGHKHMYLSKVLTGEFTRGDSSLIVPPPKDPNKKEVKYDSVVDNMANTKIYVVFFDNQAYPDYLIKFN